MRAVVSARATPRGDAAAAASAVRAHPETSQLHQSRLLGKPQHLHEQSRQRLQMPPPELADRAEVRRVARHDHHEVRPLHRRPRDPPRRVDAAGVAMQQQRRHQTRIERRLTKTTAVAADDRRQIQALAHQRYDQPRYVILCHIVLHARRQQLHIIDLPGAKFLAHNHATNQIPNHLTRHYSDRLLVLLRHERL